MSVPPSLPLTRSAQPTYIIGHKNPDADAICSALAYAAFKEASGQTGFKPARCGNSNARIDAILNRFGATLPEFVGDVIPRIEDIMHRDPFKVSVDDTCARALELLDLHDVRALPVVGNDGRLELVVPPHTNDTVYRIERIGEAPKAPATPKPPKKPKK